MKLLTGCVDGLEGKWVLEMGMGFGLAERIQRHAAMATGNFTSLFKGADLPALPEATAKLVKELNQPNPDTDTLVKVISASPEISARVIRTVNSARFALRNRVTSIRHAVTLLGLRQVKAIALSFAVIDAIPRPGGIFRADAFWQDCLTRALVARAFARRFNSPQDEEEAFTCMLLADVALPVLLTYWTEYYLPVVDKWSKLPVRLSQIEDALFRWNHAQAGAWLLRSWHFPDDMVCYVGAHNLTPGQLRELELDGTIAKALVTASVAPSILKPYRQRSRELVQDAIGTFGLSREELLDVFREVQANLVDVQGLFDLPGAGQSKILVDLQNLCGPEEDEESEESA
jgi:HD-like signal output (HDOD) protein